MPADGRSYLFRAVVLSTIIVVALSFALSVNEQGEGKHSPKEAQTSENERDTPKTFWKTLREDPTAFFTMALAGLTCVLAATGVVQIYFLNQSDRTARLSARSALKAAKAAERSATIAEAALIGTEAPFIFAIAAPWKEGDPLAPGGKPGFASVVLKNEGRSPAIIREEYCGCLVSQFLPAAIAFPPPQTALHHVTIVPAGGETDVRRYGWGALRAEDADEDGYPLNRSAAHWIVGQVRYADPFGTQYVTGYCFAYNAFSKRFYLQGGSALNYRRRLNERETRVAEERDATAPPHFPTRSDKT